MPVVRYDIIYKYSHKDLMNPDGSKEKIFMGRSDLNEALALAVADMDIDILASLMVFSFGCVKREGKEIKIRASCE